eukprot:405834_1
MATFFVLSLCVYVLLICVTVCESQWDQATSTLLWNQCCMAIGSYNDSIHILGGTKMNAITVYNTRNDRFTSDESYFTTDIFGYSSYYTQIHNVLYIITGNGSNILSYNMQTDTINYNYATMPSQVASNYEISSCMTSYTSNAKSYLFVAGGAADNWDTIYKTAHVFDISGGIWLSNVPSMKVERFSHTCIVDPVNNTLFAIGGKAESNLKSIEIISTNDIEQQQWSYFPDELSIGVRDTQSVYFDTIIYVIGGTTSSKSSSRYDTVHMIDTVSTNVNVDNILPYGVSSAATILLNHRLHVFGGFNGTYNEVYVYVNTWMYYDFPRTQPTNIPSAVPSIIPSLAPSNVPSTTPSDTPSRVPSSMPSSAPNDTPSAAPINVSSFVTTNTHSIAQTAISSIATTKKQSSSPNQESFSPTSNTQSSAKPPNVFLTDTHLIIIIIIVIGICICIIAICLLCCGLYKDAERENEMIENDMNRKQQNIQQINCNPPTENITKKIQNHQRKVLQESRKPNNDYYGENDVEEKPIGMMRTVEGETNDAVDNEVNDEMNLERRSTFIVDGDSDSQHETNKKTNFTRH